MAIPSVQNFNSQPGGGLNAVFNSINELRKNYIDTERKQLENQYYGPSQQAEIDYRNAMTKGQNINNEYLPEKNKLSNAFQSLQNQYYAPNMQSEISQRNALSNRYNTMTPLEANQLQLQNQYYPQTQEANINSQKAMANFRNMGGGYGMGAGQKELQAFQQQIMKDNPDYTPQQANQAASAYISGNEVLPDGTPLRPLSGIGESYVNQILKRGTTAPLITQNVKSTQADKELSVLNDYAQKGLEPYGDTLLGLSPTQVVDSFKKDDKSQERLGKFIASQALQFEIAQNRIRLANGQPGVTSTQELMERSGQTVDAKYPVLSYKARKTASDYMDKALREGLKARLDVDMTPIGLRNERKSSEGKGENKKATLRYNASTGDFEEIK